MIDYFSTINIFTIFKWYFTSSKIPCFTIYFSLSINFIYNFIIFINITTYYYFTFFDIFIFFF